MKVSVSGKQFVFPRSCACCGGYPLTTLRASGTERNRRARTKGWTWEIPYCVACKKHVRAFDGLLIGTLTAIAASALLSVFVGIVYRQWQLGVLAAILLSVGITAIFRVVITVIKSKRPTNCHMFGRAVEYQGSDGPCHTFNIKSIWYLSDFVRANHHKIVNASPRVASILQGSGFGRNQVPRRFFK